MIKKEFAQVLRDPRTRGIVFGPPIIMIFVFGYAISMDVNSVNMAVLDEDRTLTSRGLVEKFTGSGYFTLHSMVRSNDEVRLLMDHGKVDMFMHIGRGFRKT